jgi:hypothetical protein
MYRQLFLAATLLGGLFLTGCATVVKGTTQSIAVVTTHHGVEVAGAKCELSNAKGVWYVTTPGSADVHRGYGELAVSCKKDGLPDGMVDAKSSTTGSVFGNILLGGAIGATVDMANGAAYDYPMRISVALGQHTALDKVGPTVASGEAPQGRPVDPNVPVPYLNAPRQAKYREFLNQPMPRAFAVSINGHYGAAWSNANAPSRDRRELALKYCREAAGMECRLYAVDDRVVYAGPMPETGKTAVPAMAPGVPVPAAPVSSTATSTTVQPLPPAGALEPL